MLQANLNPAAFPESPLGAVELAHLDAQPRAYGHYARQEVLALVSRTPATYLDIGCNTGGNAEAIRKRFPGVKSFGIEIDAHAAGEARAHLDFVSEKPIEDIDWNAYPGDVAPFDLVVMADVLEHMYNPWRALESVKTKLSARGEVIASIPNVRNLALLDQIAQGHFRYGSFGLLDATHIRFFTLESVWQSFVELGFKIEVCTINLDPRCADLYGRLRADDAPQDISTAHLVIKDQTHEQCVSLCALQYLVRATLP